jgi:serine/alanine adding enzyme
MNIVKQLDHTIWKNFVLKHPCGNIFHTPEMFEVFEQTKGHKPYLWAAVDGEDRILALMLPVNILFDNRLLKPFSRDVVYGGILHELSSDGLDGLSYLLEAYKRETRGRNLYAELRNISESVDAQAVLGKNKFVFEDHLNYLIDLNRSSDEVLKSIGKRTRKHISRGLRKNILKIEVVNDRQKIAESYDLLKTTYQNASVPLAHQSLFEAAFDVLFPKGMVHFILAYIEGKPVAVSVELLYKDVIYGWYNGMDRAYSSYSPNELIMWHILRWGAENNYRLYDFGGAGKPDEDYGVRDFKAKFGGDLVNYGRNKYIASPSLYKFTEFGYKMLRGFLFS